MIVRALDIKGRFSKVLKNGSMHFLNHRRIRESEALTEE
jgi:hypothetical protein